MQWETAAVRYPGQDDLTTPILALLRAYPPVMGPIQRNLRT